MSLSLKNISTLYARASTNRVLAGVLRTFALEEPMGRHRYKDWLHTIMDTLHPGTAVELNRCIYNTMVDNPRDEDGNCLSPQHQMFPVKIVD